MDTTQGGVSAPTNAVQPSESQFYCFDAQRIGRAISFHLVDLGQARRVSDQSLQRTVVRLGREPKGLTISREAWSGMSDPQRLTWLLQESHTAVEMTGDKTALLRAAK